MDNSDIPVNNHPNMDDFIWKFSSIFVTGFEKRGHFAQNAIFCHFSTYHHCKAVRTLGFRLGLLAVWTFYFTNPTLEPRASLLSRAVSRQRGAWKGEFRTRSTESRYVQTYSLVFNHRGFPTRQGASSLTPFIWNSTPLRLRSHKIIINTSV